MASEPDDWIGEVERDERMVDPAWPPSEPSSPLYIAYITWFTRLGALTRRSSTRPARARAPIGPATRGMPKRTLCSAWAPTSPASARYLPTQVMELLKAMEIDEYKEVMEWVEERTFRGPVLRSLSGQYHTSPVHPSGHYHDISLTTTDTAPKRVRQPSRFTRTRPPSDARSVQIPSSGAIDPRGGDTASAAPGPAQQPSPAPPPVLAPRERVFLAAPAALRTRNMHGCG